MIDNCFHDLMKDENIAKMDIDESLIEAFQFAMTRMQDYFSHHHFDIEKNYTEFFQEFLLGDSERKLKIVVSDELNKGVAGRYSSSLCSLEVNKDYVQSDVNVLAHIICHEFIHFMAHHRNDILFGERWSGETFIDEGYTEQLTREIIPVDIDYYGSIPNLIDFYNQLSHSKADYSLLLDCKIQDLLRKRFFPSSFIRYGDECIQKFENGDYVDNGFESDETYLNIQRSILNQWSNSEVDSYESLMLLIETIQNRPADDREWIIDFVLDKCSKFNMDDELKKLISDYITCLSVLSRHVYHFQVGDVMLTFDGKNISGLTPDIHYDYTISHGKDILVFTDDHHNRVEFDYESVPVLDTEEFAFRKDLLEQDLNHKLSAQSYK